METPLPKRVQIRKKYWIQLIALLELLEKLPGFNLKWGLALFGCHLS
jgi:hypothetical protein